MAVFPTEQQDRAERVRVGNRFAEGKLPIYPAKRFAG